MNCTLAGSLYLIKMIINSVVSRLSVQFITFDIKNFYLETPMDRYEYVRIKLSNMPQEFIDEYYLTTHTCDGWVYFEILRGCYGLTQAEKSTNDILRVRLKKTGYYKGTTTPGLWRQKWRPIIFGLMVDNFGIEYVGKRHAHHLLHTLHDHYTINTYWEGGNFAGVDLDWTYSDKHSQRK